MATATVVVTLSILIELLTAFFGLDATLLKCFAI